MARLIFVPQLPIKMRYSEWWFTEFPKNVQDAFSEVIVLGKNNIPQNADNSGLFSNTEMAIKFELSQVEEYLDLKLEKNDVLFHADLSFPGVFHSVLFHKKPKLSLCFCHGSSLNKYDYFQKVRKEKYLVEQGMANNYDYILVGSVYHALKLKGIKNIMITGLPQPYDIFNDEIFNSNKIIDITSVSRSCIQKSTKKIEREIEKEFNTKIIRKSFDSWKDYYQHLANSKILLISSKEDTFNYSILDAYLMGCIPLAPNRLAFPELLPREYLYNNIEELKDKIKKIFRGELKPLKELNNQYKVDHFYEIFESVINETLN